MRGFVKSWKTGLKSVFRGTFHIRSCTVNAMDFYCDFSHSLSHSRSSIKQIFPSCCKNWNLSSKLMTITRSRVRISISDNWKGRLGTGLLWYWDSIHTGYVSICNTKYILHRKKNLLLKRTKTKSNKVSRTSAGISQRHCNKDWSCPAASAQLTLYEQWCILSSSSCADI